MKQIIILLCCFLTLTCCYDKNQFREYQKAKSVAGIFEYAYHNRTSDYLDSAISSLNDSLSIDKNFYLRVYEDSIVYIHLNNVNYNLKKQDVVLYNLNRNELLYIDSIYTSQAKVDSLLSLIIITRKIGAIYLYSDTLANKENWLDLFSMIDKVLFICNEHRKVYSLEKFKKKYDKLNINELNEVNSKIPIRLAIYFRNPFPPPIKNI